MRSPARSRHSPGVSTPCTPRSRVAPPPHGWRGRRRGRARTGAPAHRGRRPARTAARSSSRRRRTPRERCRSTCTRDEAAVRPREVDRPARVDVTGDERRRANVDLHLQEPRDLTGRAEGVAAVRRARDRDPVGASVVDRAEDGERDEHRPVGANELPRSAAARPTRSPRAPTTSPRRRRIVAPGSRSTRSRGRRGSSARESGSSRRCRRSATPCRTLSSHRRRRSAAASTRHRRMTAR